MHEYNFKHDECIASFAIKSFLLLNNFNTKILNQLIFTFIDNYEKIIISHCTNS